MENLADLFKTVIIYARGTAEATCIGREATLLVHELMLLAQGKIRQKVWERLQDFVEPEDGGETRVGIHSCISKAKLKKRTRNVLHHPAGPRC